MLMTIYANIIIYSYHQYYISEQKIIHTAFLFRTCMIHFRSCTTRWRPSNISKPVEIIFFFFLCKPTYFIVFKTTKTLCFSCKRKQRAYVMKLFYALIRLCWIDRTNRLIDIKRRKIPNKTMHKMKGHNENPGN